MRIKKVALGILSAIIVGGGLAAVIYYVATRDPVAIKVGPRLYDDYVGYYDFGNGYVIHVQREGERLISHAPERAPQEWFPESESHFFVKGERVRITFHRNETGRGVRKNLASHSDGIVVVDQWGNVAVVGHTINTSLWGNTGIFVDGISIPDAASFQPADIARAGPGNHLPNGMNPMLFLRDGKAVLGCSAVGGGLHYKTLQALVCVLDFDMDPQTAVDTPAFLPNGVVKGTFDPKVLEGMKALGMEVNILSEKEAQLGYWVGVQVNPTNRHLFGGVSRGLESQVVG